MSITLVAMKRSRTNPDGFTLVELLIVISIIGILMALLLPAVNSARESGRRAQCLNNCKQLALACLSHEAKYRFLPTGGWGYMWVGDPDRGFTKRQPGGWHYNILPYIDQVDLHDLGSGGRGQMPSATVMAQAATRAQKPVAIFLCPTRHKLQAFLYSSTTPPFNCTVADLPDRPERLRRQRRRRQ